jgi:hypothetical protein
MGSLTLLDICAGDLASVADNSVWQMTTKMITGLNGADMRSRWW